MKTGDHVSAVHGRWRLHSFTERGSSSIQTTPNKGQLNPQFVRSGPPATWLAPTVMTWTSSVADGVWG